MAEDLLSKRLLRRVIGQARLLRLIRAGWLAPFERTPSGVLFRVADVHAALRRLERQVCPPDRIRVAQVRAWERANGHERVRKPPRPRPPGLDEIQVDFSGFKL